MMKNWRYTIVLAMLCVAAVSFADAPRRDTLVFITSRNQPTKTLSAAEIRSIFLGQKTRWKNGRRITVIVRPATTAAGRIFLERVVRTSEIDFAQHWLGVVFRGEAPSAPQVIASADAVRRWVAADTDAIAFVLGSELAGENEALIQTLAIDDPARDSDSYPFTIH
jgi:ABC-type phosphate transport system substrate-binding protein